MELGGDKQEARRAALAEASSALEIANETGTTAEAHAAFRRFAQLFAATYGPTEASDDAPTRETY
jgi:hypothetical protein